MERTPASQAWRAMRQLLMQGEGHRQVLQACSDAGLTPGMLKMGLQLSSDRPQAMRELADRFHCDASYVTSLVDGLEQQGMAERRPHPRDRRIKTVVLTQHGIDVLARVNAVLDQPPAAFTVLNEDEKVLLRDLLLRLVTADGANEAGNMGSDFRSDEGSAEPDGWAENPPDGHASAETTAAGIGPRVG
jgi:DNA-binding MarR family transcriptional regulator